MRAIRTAMGTAVIAAALAAPLDAQVQRDTTQRDTIARLDAVTIHAHRIAGSPATAPYARTVRSTSALGDRLPAIALDDALRGIPGLQVDNRFNYALGERISIRGAGARAQFGVRGVRILVDGIPATLPDGQSALNQVDLGTIAGAEVIRGPVSSLYGNAGGGAILLETRRARGGSATVVAGGGGLLRTRLDAGHATGDLALDGSISRVGFDGHRTHSEAENVYASARASWVGARDHLRATLHVVEYDALNPGSLSDSLLRVDRTQAYRNNILQRTGETGNQQQLGIHWQRALPAAGMLEVSGWGTARAIDNPIPGRVVVVDRAAAGARAIVRRMGTRLSWTAGLEHERQRDDRQNYVNDEGAHGALTLDQLETVVGTGAFVQASLPLHSRVTLLGGVRHDRTTFDATDRFIDASDPDDSGTRTMSAFSPSGGVSLLLGGGALLYANVGTAFETPTTTELANRPGGAGGFNPTLAPQRTISYEVGARRTTGRLGIEAALYRAFVRDALIPFEVPDLPGRQYFRNAGSTQTSGVELAATFDVTRRLRLEAAYTLADAAFREYTVDGTTYDGNAVPGVARHRAEMTTTFTLGSVRLVADVRHQSRMAANDANTAWSPAFTLLDLRATSGGLRVGPAGVALTAGVQNIFGTEYNSSVVVNAFGRRYFEPGPGRAVFVGATIRAAGR